MKFMFSCKDIHDRASLFIDGNCSLPTKAGMLMHLLMCGKCHLFVKQLRLTVALLRKMPTQYQSNSDLEAMADNILAKNKMAEITKKPDHLHH